MSRPIVVFDCMVFLQAAASAEGPSRACLELARTGQIELVASSSILAEIKEVLGRPKVRKKFPSLTDDKVDLYLKDVQGLSRLAEAQSTLQQLPRDPKDEPYLNLALGEQARYLVSWDKDLLDLMTTSLEGVAFRTKWPDLTILTPVDFLHAMTQATMEPASGEQ